MALTIEAIICFGVPALLLVAGIPILVMAVWSVYLGLAAGSGVDVEQLGILALFVGGALGVIGAVNLTRKAIRTDSRMRSPGATLAFVCAGASAVTGAASFFDLQFFATTAAPLAATMHFLYLARGNFTGENHDGTRRALGDVLAATLVIGVALINLLYAQADDVGPNAAAHRRIQRPDPCMRWFREGAIPRASFRLDIREAQWPQLATTLARFAQAHKLQFHDGSAQYPDTSHILYLSLCGDTGTWVMSSKQLWRIGPQWDWERDLGIDVSIYSPAKASEWNELADRLQAALEQAWPGKVTRK